MITIINTKCDTFDMSMSISEMCAETNHKVEIALMEMDMNILLFENQYLKENGTLCAYNEAIDFAAIKENVKKAISDAIAWIKTVFNSLIEKIKNAAIKVRAWITRSGLTLEKAKNIFAQAKKIADANDSDWVDKNDFHISNIECYPDYFDVNKIESRYKELTRRYVQYEKVIPEHLKGKTAIVGGFGELQNVKDLAVAHDGTKELDYIFGTKGPVEVINSINNCSKSVEKELNNMLKKFIAENNPNNEQIKDAKNAIKAITSASTEAVKVYWTNYSAVVKIIRSLNNFVKANAKKLKKYKI